MSTGPEQQLPTGERLEALADGTAAPDLGTPGEAALAAWARAARGPADVDELVGRSAALRAFAAAQPAQGAVRVLRPLVKVGIGVAAAGLVLGGTAAAAYTGGLPGPLQQLAHRTIGAPAPAADQASSAAAGDRSAAHQGAEGVPGAAGTASRSPVTATPSVAGEPSATASPRAVPPTPPAGAGDVAAYGRCRAFVAAGSHLNPNSAVIRSLAALAGGPDRIAAYCTVVLAQHPAEHTAAATPPGQARGGSGAKGHGPSSKPGTAHHRSHPTKPTHHATPHHRKLPHPAQSARPGGSPVTPHGQGAPPAHPAS